MTGDPLWPVLARRLSAAGRRGADLEEILATALDQGRLPDERPAAALWFRLAGQLRLTSADIDPDIRLRPAWTDDLLQRLPDRVGQRLLTSPAWPELVAVVTDSVTHTDLPAADLLDRAIGTLNLADQAVGGLPGRGRARRCSSPASVNSPPTHPTASMTSRPTRTTSTPTARTTSTTSTGHRNQIPPRSSSTRPTRPSPPTSSSRSKAKRSAHPRQQRHDRG